MKEDAFDEVTSFVLAQWDEIEKLEKAKEYATNGFPAAFVELLRGALQQREWWGRDWRIEHDENGCICLMKRSWSKVENGEDACLFLSGLEIEELNEDNAEERSYIGLQIPEGRHKWKSKLRSAVAALREQKKDTYIEGEIKELEHLKRVLPPLHPSGFAGTTTRNLEIIMSYLDVLVADTAALVDAAIE